MAARRWTGRCSVLACMAAMLAWSCAEDGGTESPAATAEHLRFERALLLEQTDDPSANVSIGDLDRDGHLDILLVKGRHDPYVDFVLLGDGTGAFAPSVPLSEQADRSYSGVLVDMDGDGDLDVVVSNDFPDRKLVYLNDGAARFTVGSTFGEAQWPTRHVSVADLNGDGLPDIVVANRTGGNGRNYVCFNRGLGRFDAECDGFSSESTTTITPADFNGDGWPDLAVPHRDIGQSHIYWNDGSGGFGDRTPFGAPDAAIRKAEAADVNGDGRIDLVVIDERKGPAVHLGRDDGSFEAARPLGDAGPTPYALAVADVDRDGAVDVIVGYVNARPIVWFGDGSGAFTAVPFGDDQGVAYGFAVGDIDEDGVADIAMARSAAPNVLYFGSPNTPGRQ